MPVAFLFTDIEGSTLLAERCPDGYRGALDIHHQIVRSMVRAQGGEEFQDTGDGFYLAFGESTAAARAAIAIQKRLGAAAWPKEIGSIKVRMALHWTETEYRDGQHRGIGVHFAARLLAAGHGGQILCSESAAAALAGADDEALPEGGLHAKKLGSFRLRGFLASETIYQLGPAEDFPSLKAEAARRHNLPPLQDAFVGRETELARIADVLSPHASSVRLLTITGLGGIGKTRLAIAAAHRLLDAFDQSALFVPIADIQDASSVPAAICAAVEGTSAFCETPGRLRALLSGAPTLVVLDNFEHLAAGGGAVLDQLLAEVPELHFLVTSRMRLGRASERELPLSPFAVPHASEIRPERLSEFDCVQMFLERATRARDGIALTASNAREIGAICRLLAGLPLALELAAARLGVLTETELRESLERDFPRFTHEASPELSHSLQAVFEWSRSLLPPDVAKFLAKLTVFRNGWTAAAANEICDLQNAPLALAYLHYLITCSLVRAFEAAGRVRFEMLEPIRQMACAGLEDRASTYQRHFDYFAALVHKAVEAYGRIDPALAPELDVETPNILAALAQEPNDQRRIFSAVDFHAFAGNRACNRLLRPILTEVREGGAVSPGTLASGWMAAGYLDLIVRDLSSAEHAYEQAAKFFEQAGEDYRVHLARFNLGIVAGRRGDYRKARDIYEHLRERIHPSRAGAVLSSLAEAERGLGDIEAGRHHAEESITLSRMGSDSRTLASALCTLGKIYLAAGNLAEAHGPLVEALRLKLELGHSLDIIGYLCPIGELSLRIGDWESAVFLYGAARAQIEKHGITPGSETLECMERLQKDCLAAIGESAFELSRARGASSTVGQWTEKATQLCLPAKTFFSQVQSFTA